MLDPRIQNYLILGKVGLIRLFSSGLRKWNYVYVTSQQTVKCSPVISRVIDCTYQDGI